jgi:hypothetical protein
MARDQADAKRTPAPSQADKLKQAVRDLERDEDEARWDERLRKVAAPEPVVDKPVWP